jgi:hypothetical protein
MPSWPYISFTEVSLCVTNWPPLLVRSGRERSAKQLPLPNRYNGRASRWREIKENRKLGPYGIVSYHKWRWSHVAKFETEPKGLMPIPFACHNLFGRPMTLLGSTRKVVSTCISVKGMGGVVAYFFFFQLPQFA